MNRILCVVGAFIVVSGCTTTVDLQISNEECTLPEKIAATPIGVDLTSSTLKQPPITSDEITNAFVRLRGVHTEDVKTFAKWGVVRTVGEDLAGIAVKLPQASPLTAKAAQDAQQQLVDVLSDLPASAQAQFNSGKSGAVKVGSIGSGHASNLSQFGRTLVSTRASHLDG